MIRRLVCLLLCAAPVLSSCTHSESAIDDDAVVDGKADDTDDAEGLLCQDIWFLNSSRWDDHRRLVADWAATQPGFTFTPSFSKTITVPYDWSLRTVLIEDERGVVFQVRGHVTAHRHQFVEKVLVFDTEGSLVAEIDGHFNTMFDAELFIINRSRAAWGVQSENDDPFPNQSQALDIVTRDGEIVTTGSVPPNAAIRRAGDTFVAFGSVANSPHERVALIITRDSIRMAGSPACLK